MNKINPEFREYLPDLSSIDIEPLAREIEEYNDRFSVGVVAARKLVPEREAGVEQALPGTLRQEQRTRLEGIQSKQGEILARVGLSFEPVSGGAFVMTEHETDVASILRLNLADRTRYLEYLRALQPERLTESQARGLVAVAESLTEQLATVYDLRNSKDDRMIELLGGLEAIVKEYQRLDPAARNGLAGSIERLRVYSVAAGEKYLREFLLVEKHGLLAEVGGKNFGPSKWQTDSTPQYLQRRWHEALAVLQEVARNESARPLAERLSEHLRACLEYARQDLGQREESHITGSGPDKLLRVINRASYELDSI